MPSTASSHWFVNRDPAPSADTLFSKNTISTFFLIYCSSKNFLTSSKSFHWSLCWTVVLKVLRAFLLWGVGGVITKRMHIRSWWYLNIRNCYFPSVYLQPIQQLPQFQHLRELIWPYLILNTKIFSCFTALGKAHHLS